MSHRINYQDIDCEEFLNDLGLHNVKKDGREVFFSCPFEGHNHGDLNPSASMQQGTTKVHCFGCGFNGNALTFLAEYENCSPLQASRYIREYLGVSFKEPEGSLLDELNKYFSKEREEEIKRNQPLDISELHKRAIDWQSAWENGADSPEHWLFDRGFHWQVLEEWHIGWDDISQRFTIPWFDADGALIGFKGRALDHDVGNGNARYKVLGGPEYGFDTFDVSLRLFGIDKQSFASKDLLIIVEGELNVLALDQADIYCKVGISGKHISDAQAYVLGQMDRELILWFDDVDDEIKAAKKLVPTNNKISWIPEHDKDPADSTPDEIRDLLSRRESAIMLV